MSGPVHFCGHLRQQQGQALVLGMLLAGVAAVVLVRYFAVGQVVAAKAKQLHSLDATAYSGALIQARALNMLSYLNRTQVGHQVAMAHLVTLGTWASLGGYQARQLAAGNPPAHLIAMLFGAGHGAAYVASRGAVGLESMAQVQGELAQSYAAHSSQVHDLLSRVQDDIVTGLPQARNLAMQSVMARNDPDASFNLSVVHDNWQGYVRRYWAQQSLRPFLQELAGMYSFLLPRNTTASNPWPVDVRCPTLRHQLRRRGTTELDEQGRWQSIDTQSFHALRSNRWIGCYFREYPMGWGWVPTAQDQRADVPYVENPPANFASQDFWRWVQEATNWDIASGDVNPLANSKAAAGRQRWLGGGLPTYFDLAAPLSGHDLGFTVQLSQPGPEGLTITSRSAAETFFDRPEPRSDQLPESSNLFHPYWQARLAPVDPYDNVSKVSP